MNSISTVWITSDGEYSDYGVTGVFLNKEDAALATKAFGWNNNPVEWKISEVAEEAKAGMFHFYVGMDEDGNNASGSIHSSRYTTDRDRMHTAYGSRPRRFVTNTWARDEAHAIKIANDRRAEWLAREAGK